MSMGIAGVSAPELAELGGATSLVNHEFVTRSPRFMTGETMLGLAVELDAGYHPRTSNPRTRCPSLL
jgi:hypothetical protein